MFYSIIRYFTAFIYQFQFYREMCLAAGKYDPQDPKKPLHRSIKGEGSITISIS